MRHQHHTIGTRSPAGGGFAEGGTRTLGQRAERGIGGTGAPA